MKNEIKTAASSNGRKITLDPIKTFTVPIELREVESTLPCGFRAEWVTGKNGKKPFSLTSGAGLGSKWMTLEYGGRSFCADIGQVVEQFIVAIDNEQAATGKAGK